MKIGFIGAGKVGSSFGMYLYEHGFFIAGYYSRSSPSATDASERTGSKVYDSIEAIAKACDIVFVTTGDDAIGEVIRRINAVEDSHAIPVHMSGALSTEDCGGDCMSLHPLVAVSDKSSSNVFSDCVFSLEGREIKGRELLTEMMQTTGNTLVEIEPSDKTKYHGAAVFASNLVVGLYSHACRLLTECGFDEATANEALSGLFLKNATQIAKKGPVDALTGPVERADASTVQGHINVLDEESKTLYKALSKDVLAVAKSKNPGRDYSKIEEILS